MDREDIKENKSKSKSQIESGIKDATLIELFIEFFKLGLFTIGGGITMIPLIQGIVSDRKKWMTEDEVIDCVAVSQSLPGVIAINMATYVGNRKKGMLGAIAATVGVILPSIITIILVVELLDKIGDNRYVQGALYGIRAAATGLIVYAAYSIGAKVLVKGTSFDKAFSWIVAVSVFIAVALFKVNVVYVVPAVIVTGILASVFVRRKMAGGEAE